MIRAWRSSRFRGDGPGAVVGLVGAAGVSLAHEHRLKDSATTRDLIYAAVPATDLVVTNPEGAKFLSAAWGPTRFVVADGSQDLPPALGSSGVAVVFVSRTGDQADRSLLAALADSIGATKTADRKRTWEVEIWRR